MWLRVLTNRKFAIYSDGDIIIIIIIRFLGLRWFKLVLFVLHWLRWYYIGCVGIALVALVIRWYFVGSVGNSYVVIPSLNVDGK